MADLIVELYGTRVGRLTGDTRNARAHPRLAEDVARFARNLLEGRPAGPPAP